VCSEKRAVYQGSPFFKSLSYIIRLGNTKKKRVNQMIENKKPSNNYQKIDPDDFENYEEQFVDKGGGGGKTSGHKGKKTFQALKKQQRNHLGQASCRT